MEDVRRAGSIRVRCTTSVRVRENGRGSYVSENEELFEEMVIPESETAFAGHSCLCFVTEYDDSEPAE
ncbi:azolemycin family RiPP peptide [Streptomyces sp. NPDC001339]|uniref:azolemycin family RiPP peptide n=1 Tax=Streptomyces sp. NPDC001339 TaxID=3364563 RepID=UPI00369712CE